MTGSAPPPPWGDPRQQPSTPPPAYGQGYPVPGGVQPGPLLERFVARLLDWILIVVVLGIVSLIVSVAAAGVSIGIGTGVSYGVNLVTSIVGAVVTVGYFALMESTTGQTVGKMVMKLRVVGPDGTSKPTMSQAVKRNLYTGFEIFGVIPFVGGLVSLVVILVADILIAVQINGDPARRQGWHDRFAGGTAVVKQL